MLRGAHTALRKHEVRQAHRIGDDRHRLWPAGGVTIGKLTADNPGYDHSGADLLQWRLYSTGSVHELSWQMTRKKSWLSESVTAVLVDLAIPPNEHVLAVTLYALKGLGPFHLTSQMTMAHGGA